MRTLSTILFGGYAIMLSACNYATTDPASESSKSGATVANSAKHGASGDTIFVQTFPQPDYPTPDTTTRGRFEVRGSCLNFVTAEGAFRAVLPAGSRFSPPSAVTLADGRKIGLGEMVVLKGAEGEFGPGSSVPAACPTQAMLIGGVE